MEEIVIDISSDGKRYTIEGNGFSGDDCKQFTKAIEEELGEVESVDYKPEYRQMKSRARTVAR